MTAAWLLAPFACRAPAVPPLPTFPDATATTGTTAETGRPPSPPTPTGATGDTGIYPPWSVTWDKGTWPDWAKNDVIPPLSSDLLVPPSVRIVGYPGALLAENAGSALIPAYGSDPGAMFVGSGGAFSSGLDQPLVFILSGGLPRGEYTLYDAWDGVSGGYGWLSEDVGEIGDVDGDGHLDFWSQTNLFRGPVLGRGYPPHWVHDDATAWLADWGFHHASGRYDADGDGINDVLFGVGTTGFLAFGPFEGLVDLPWYAPTPEGFVVFGEQWCSDNTGAHPTLLRDEIAPGHHAVAIGRCTSGYEATRIYDLEGPRDRFVSIDDALAVVGNTSGIEPVVDPGDLNGDGIGDVEIQGLAMVAGPVAGFPRYAPPILTLPDGRFPGISLGDMNGDGVTELLGYDIPTDTYVVLFSPHPNPVDLSQGLRMSHGPYELTSLFFRPPSDVDGDGRADIVYGYPPLPPDNRGEVRIWSGADLVAAYAAQRRAAPTPPRSTP